MPFQFKNVSIHQIFTIIKLQSFGNFAGHTFNAALPAQGGNSPVRFLEAMACEGISSSKVPDMIHYSTRDEISACRAFALDRNRHLFEEAQALSNTAFELLEGSDLDAEQFDRYQAMRRRADLKYEEAIEHLRLLNEDFPAVTTAPPLTQRPVHSYESRA
ncbi:MAG: hypothetical protein M3Q94_07760 [Pseudomonadota bacterium]|nr:hypothetical protein [Pseudomonadota bacterium]